jgi:hypothetical protein
MRNTGGSSGHGVPKTLSLRAGGRCGGFVFGDMRNRQDQVVEVIVRVRRKNMGVISSYLFDSSIPECANNLFLQEL